MKCPYSLSLPVDEETLDEMEWVGDGARRGEGAGERPPAELDAHDDAGDGWFCRERCEYSGGAAKLPGRRPELAAVASWIAAAAASAGCGSSCHGSAAPRCEFPFPGHAGHAAAASEPNKRPTTAP